jgi:signal transduction histidine kinase
MNTTLKRQPSPWRYFWLIALLGLPALGWYGILDDFSSNDINASISNAGLIYGTARGINALVSLLQGTELNIPLLTFSIGEVLDPVNDLIERFSQVILLALGSLALQKILLAVVSHTMFNILLSAVAVCTGVSLFLDRPRILSALLKAFLMIAFFRFSLSLVVLANSWVDTTFLDEADQQRHLAMEVFQGKLRKIETFSKGGTESETPRADIEKRKIELADDLRQKGGDLEKLDARIKVTSADYARSSKKAGVLCQIAGLPNTCPENVIRVKNTLQDLETQRAAIVKEVTSIEEAIETLQDKLDCIEKQSRGEVCSIWEHLPSAPNPAAVRQKLNEVNDSLSDFAENCINLLASLLLKTVAIPLLFIYLLLKIVRINWARI